MNSHSKFGPLIGVVHVGQVNCKFLVYAARNAEVLTCHEIKLTSISQQPGWVEFDPSEIWTAVTECIKTAISNLIILDINPADIVSIGITNQRETTVLWNKYTGLPLYNSIAWCDTRTSSVVSSLLERTKNKINFLKSVCGLPISTCFSAVKIKWLLDNVEDVREAIEAKTCLFGTLDSWIIWNLTGGRDGGTHVTDVTNASRTMLMNLETLEWDYRLCNFFKITPQILPKIKSCSEIYGYVTDGPLIGIPIASCIGDQQAALLGQMCLGPGQANCNIDEGCFLLFNTAEEIIDSDNGLLSTVAFKLGQNEKTYYALEGAVAHAGSSITWLKENLQLETEANHNGSSVHSFLSDLPLISSFCTQSASMYAMDTCLKNSRYEVIFVPAFSGYYSPHWKYNARGLIFGLTSQTTAQQVLYSAYEAICFQVRDMLESLENDCKTWPKLTKLIIGGELSEKSFLLQIISDLSGISIEKPQTSTPSCLGAMLAAGLATNILNLEDFKSVCVPPIDHFNPNLNSSQRDIKYRKWKIAVEKCLNFQTTTETEISKFALEDKDPDMSVRCSIPGGVFFFTSFAILILAQMLQNR